MNLVGLEALSPMLVLTFFPDPVHICLSYMLWNIASLMPGSASNLLSDLAQNPLMHSSTKGYEEGPH